jgi:hypothetical protein
VQLNTVVRPPAEKWALPLGRQELEVIKRRLGGSAEVVAHFRKRPQSPAAGELGEAVFSLLARRPATLRDIAVSLGRNEPEVLKHLASLIKEGKLKKVKHKGLDYYEPA